MNGLRQDLRYAVRQLRRNPGFACTVVAILAVGIGASTAIFSAVNPILFEPLPYPKAGQIMMIWYAGADGSRIPQAFHTFRELAQRSGSFDAIAVMKLWQPTLSGADQPERFDGQQVSAQYFRSLGEQPALGRDFSDSDDVPNGPKVAIISYRLWRRRFGGDRAIIGQQARLDDSSYTIIGVMPARFENVLAPSADVWSPLQYNAASVTSLQAMEWGHHLRMMGRLRDGLKLDQARNDLDRIAQDPVPEYPRPKWVSLEHGVIVNSLQDEVTRGVRPALLAVLGAVLLVLLIGCVNVTNLLLARGAQRHGEFAIRAALGAGQSRLTQQLVTESLLLAVIGGALGLMLAQVGVRALVALSPPEIPRGNATGIDRTVFAFGLAVSGLVGVVAGLIPALFASRAGLQVVMQQSAARATRSHQWTRSVLVIAEVALSLVLLSGAGLLFHSLRRMFAVPPGFDASNLLTMQVQTYGRRYDDDRLCHRFFDQALEAVRRVPGVTAAAFTSQLPLSGDSDVYGAQFEHDNPETGYPVFRYAVTPGYFKAVGVPLLRGRLLESGDVAGAPESMLISESLAKRRFPGQDPVGKRVRVGGGHGAPMYTIVGVVGDVRQMSLAASESDAVYTTTDQWHWADGTLSLVVRARGDAAALTAAVKKAIWSVDRDPAIVRVAMMSELLAASAAERRFVLILFEAFGLVSLLLAATGIYGVLSGRVTERVREIGVRAALGATRRDILALVIRQGMTLTFAGIVIGLSGAVAASLALDTLLFGVSRLDPFAYLGVIALLGCTSLIACGIPAWRAAAVDPMTALRYE